MVGLTVIVFIWPGMQRGLSRFSSFWAPDDRSVS
jgi:hypothetical protein